MLLSCSGYMCACVHSYSLHISEDKKTDSLYGGGGARRLSSFSSLSYKTRLHMLRITVTNKVTVLPLFQAASLPVNFQAGYCSQ
jgi:hypothetical protein